ncbi:MAG: septum formation family protein, partial [Acidimicrobiales bacterium]
AETDDRSRRADGSGVVDAGLSTDPAVAHRPGSCHQTPADTMASVEVPCGRLHTIEVYAVGTLAGDGAAPFPGLDAAVALCDQEFRTRHGIGIGLATILERSVVRPSEDSWLAGERDVACYVTYPAPTTLTLDGIDPLRAFGRVSVYGLQAGDCLVDFERTSTGFGLVDCWQPHDAEVFTSVVLDDGPFPGEAEIDRIADETCFGDPFAEFVGIPYESSTLTSMAGRPTASTWDHGHRTIACILTDSLVRTGSFAGTGA